MWGKTYTESLEDYNTRVAADGKRDKGTVKIADILANSHKKLQ